MPAARQTRRPPYTNSSIAPWTSPGSSEREVTTIANLRPSARRATYGNQRRDGPSHQCASSINSSSGPCAAALAVNQYRPCSAASGGSNAASVWICDRTGPASAPAPASKASRSSSSAAASSGSSSCRTIPNGNDCSSSDPRAVSTRKSPADSRASISSRDLPIPGGPSMNSAPPIPARAFASRRSSASDSRSRSTSGAARTATGRS